MTGEQYKARFWQYKTKDAEEFDSLDEAVAYLANGWERGKLSEIDVVGPDGLVVLSGDDLRTRMLSMLGA